MDINSEISSSKTQCNFCGLLFDLDNLHSMVNCADFACILCVEKNLSKYKNKKRFCKKRIHIISQKNDSENQNIFNPTSYDIQKPNKNVIGFDLQKKDSRENVEISKPNEGEIITNSKLSKELITDIGIPFRYEKEDFSNYITCIKCGSVNPIRPDEVSSNVKMTLCRNCDVKNLFNIPINSSDDRKIQLPNKDNSNINPFAGKTTNEIEIKIENKINNNNAFTDIEKLKLERKEYEEQMIIIEWIKSSGLTKKDFQDLKELLVMKNYPNKQSNILDNPLAQIKEQKDLHENISVIKPNENLQTNLDSITSSKRIQKEENENLKKEKESLSHIMEITIENMSLINNDIKKLTNSSSFLNDKIKILESGKANQSQIDKLSREINHLYESFIDKNSFEIYLESFKNELDNKFILKSQLENILYSFVDGNYFAKFNSRLQEVTERLDLMFQEVDKKILIFNNFQKEIYTKESVKLLMEKYERNNSKNEQIIKELNAKISLLNDKLSGLPLNMNINDNSNPIKLLNSDGNINETEKIKHLQNEELNSKSKKEEDLNNLPNIQDIEINIALPEIKPLEPNRSAYITKEENAPKLGNNNLENKINYEKNIIDFKEEQSKLEENINSIKANEHLKITNPDSPLKIDPISSKLNLSSQEELKEKNNSRDNQSLMEFPIKPNEIHNIQQVFENKNVLDKEKEQTLAKNYFPNEYNTRNDIPGKLHIECSVCFNKINSPYYILPCEHYMHSECEKNNSTKVCYICDFPYITDILVKKYLL